MLQHSMLSVLWLLHFALLSVASYLVVLHQEFGIMFVLYVACCMLHLVCGMLHVASGLLHAVFRLHLDCVACGMLLLASCRVCIMNFCYNVPVLRVACDVVFSTFYKN